MSQPAVNSPQFCPFIGLVPFDEAQAEYFFGREKDTEIIVTNLRASRLTILYGGSGVGKSSVIRAGVVPYLRRASKISAIPGEPPDFLYVIVREWINDPVLSLKVGIKQAVEDAVENGSIPELTPDDINAVAAKNINNRNIASVIREWTDLIKTKFLFVFDQFEDFFTHPEFMSGADSFGEGLPLAIGDEKVSANYLISMRDDSISKLDFFRGRLGPLNNLLRLHHLDRALTEEAIRKPVDKFDQNTGEHFTVEDDLIAEVVEKVRVGNIKFETQGKAKSEPLEITNTASGTEEYQAETPYLQLVMVRLWNHKITQSTQRLSLGTLVDEDKLGGVDNIVETHLDEVMSGLGEEDMALASEFIHFTVTRAGTKIPSDAAGLAEWAKLPEKIPDIERILKKLSTGPNPVFKEVTNLRDKSHKYYEVAHDALAPAILSWRTRYLERDRAKRLEKASSTIGLFKRIAAGLGPLILLILVAAFTWVYFRSSEAETVRNEADRKAEVANQREANVNAEVNAQVTQERQLDKLSQESRNNQIAQILGILTSLSRNSAASSNSNASASNASTNDKDKQLAELGQLVDTVTLTDQERTAFLALAKIMDPATNKQIKEILDRQQPQQSRRVFLQFLQPNVDDPEGYLKDAEDNLRKLLGQANYTVPKSQVFPNISLSSTQVRYFYEDDAGQAGKIAQLLLDAGIPRVSAKFLRGYQNTGVPPGQTEIWFAPDALTVPGTVRAADFYLRSTPEAKANNKVIRVQRGETVQRQICPFEPTQVRGQTVRWCRMYYDGHFGWGLDIWLDYSD